MSFICTGVPTYLASDRAFGGKRSIHKVFNAKGVPVRVQILTSFKIFFFF